MHSVTGSSIQGLPVSGGPGEYNSMFIQVVSGMQFLEALPHFPAGCHPGATHILHRSLPIFKPTPASNR